MSEFRADDTAAVNHVDGTAGATHLVFGLGTEHYAAPVGAVEEVLEWQTVTVVPRCPAYLRGIINVRGTLVPVLDLRHRFGMAAPERTAGAGVDAGGHILVMRTRYGEQEIRLGVMVDAVQGVVDIDAASLDPPPRIGGSIDGAAVEGVARQGDRLLLVIDPDGLLPKEQLEADFDALDVRQNPL